MYEYVYVRVCTYVCNSVYECAIMCECVCVCVRGVCWLHTCMCMTVYVSATVLIHLNWVVEEIHCPLLKTLDESNWISEDLEAQHNTVHLNGSLQQVSKYTVL